MARSGARWPSLPSGVGAWSAAAVPSPHQRGGPARPRPVRVVVAPDAFRGSVTAAQAAEAIARGIESVCPTAEVRRVPVADGGEGTVECAVACGFDAHPVTVTGPLGGRVQGRIAVRGRTAVIELAELCGWATLPDGRTAPLDADTRGLGDGLRAALDLGCDDLVIAVGGSVSTDAGIGMLSALGAVPLDADGAPVGGAGGRHLHRIRSVDITALDPRLAGARVRLATDVVNPLVGERGAAAVFAPQKGADAAEVAELAAGLVAVADVIAGQTGVRTHELAGAGAAGGVGATAVPYLGADIVSGADLVLDLIGFAGTVDGADWVVTGEGRWDGQSGGGKAPARVAGHARAGGARVALLAGVVDATPADLRDAGISVSCALVELEPDPDLCMQDAQTLLVAAGAVLVERISRGDFLD